MELRAADLRLPPHKKDRERVGNIVLHLFFSFNIFNLLQCPSILFNFLNNGHRKGVQGGTYFFGDKHQVKKRLVKREKQGRT